MQKSCLIGPDLYTDIEFFQSYENNIENTIVNSVYSHSPNESCKDNIVNILNNPIYDIDELKGRQIYIQKIISRYSDNCNMFDECFKRITEYEKDVLWYIEDKQNEVEQMFENLDSVFFKFFLFEKIGFNKSDSILLFKNIYNICIYPLCIILSPMMYVLLPFLILTKKMKLSINFKTYTEILYKSFISTLHQNSGHISKVQLVTYIISIILYFHGLVNTLNLSITTFKTCSYINSKINNILLYLQNCNTLCEKLFENGRDDHILKLVEKANTYNIGSKLNIYRNMDKDYIKQYLLSVNEKFAYYTLSKLRNEYNMCYTDYNETDHFKIEGKETYHISIKNPIKNDFQMIDRGMVITGPNAGGKSTLIKSILINVVFSQTIGIANATSFEITPFYFINSQINIPDIKGHASLFEAEMLRCKYNLNTLKTIDNKPSFIVLDEVFSSTNIIEGISGAYAILSKLASYSNNCTIVTTHLIYLTKLKQYDKFKMISEEKEGKICFPFKLKKGVSNQYIALELLKGSFDEEIITEALKIKNKLLV